MPLFSAFNNRDSTLTITVCDINGDPVVLDTGDYFRIKIGREQNTPFLELVGGTPSANGSFFRLIKIHSTWN
jgi:hypothetical protein